MSEQDKEVGLGAIPEPIQPPGPIATQAEATLPESNPTPPPADILADEAPVDELELPTQVKQPEPEPVSAQPAVEEQTPPAAEEGSEEDPAQEKSIWDDCEDYEVNPENIRNLQPVFMHEDAPYGADIALPPTTDPNMTVLAGSKDIQSERDFIWMVNSQQAARVSPKDDIMMRRIQREGSDWGQAFPYNDANGKPQKLAMLPSGKKLAVGPGQRLEGGDALDRFMYGTTMGSPVTVPLTNTGIWVKLSPAGASFLAELDRSLAYARMQVGLDTNGMTGSVDDLIFREIINEAALKLVTATNFPVRNPMDLREIIDDEDHKTLSWALAKVIYPKGVMVSIPCIDPACGEVSTFRANPARMHLIDRSKLNDKQMQYLSRGISTPMTAEDVADYKAQFKKSSKYSVRIENREFIFRSPTVAQKLQIGRAWLSTVNQAVDVAMATNPDDDQKRNEVIQSITSIEQICRWGHYVGEIRIYNDEDDAENYYSVDGEDEIRTILKTLSTAPEILDALIGGIEEFLVEIGTTIIGYPNTPCKACEHKNVPDRLKNKLILPFDPDTGFFILAQRKISQAGGMPLTDLSTFGVGNLGAMAQAQEQMDYSSLDMS